MKTKTKKAPMTVDELKDGYRARMLQTTRRHLALRRHYPGCFVTYVRAAPSGIHANTYLVAVVRKGNCTPDVEAMSAAELDSLASGVTEAELREWYAARASTADPLA